MLRTFTGRVDAAVAHVDGKPQVLWLASAHHADTRRISRSGDLVAARLRKLAAWAFTATQRRVAHDRATNAGSLMRCPRTGSQARSTPQSCSAPASTLYAARRSGAAEEWEASTRTLRSINSSPWSR